MACGDLDESVGKIPGNHQRTSCLAVIDPAQFLFDHEKIVGLVCSAVHDVSVCPWHHRGQSDLADVMTNPDGVGEVGIEGTRLCASLGDNRAGEAVTPAQLHERCERALEVCLQAD